MTPIERAAEFLRHNEFLVEACIDEPCAKVTEQHKAIRNLLLAYDAYIQMDYDHLRHVDNDDLSDVHRQKIAAYQRLAAAFPEEKHG